MPIITMLESIRPSGWRRPFAERVAGEHDLADDLAGVEIADQPHRAGMAEAAIERAADLARDAQRAAVRVGDEHHLEIVAVGGAQQPFAGAVGRDLLDRRFRAGRSRSARRARRAAAWRCRSSPRSRWRRDCRSGARAAWRAASPASARAPPRRAPRGSPPCDRPTRLTRASVRRTSGRGTGTGSI